MFDMKESIDKRIANLMLDLESARFCFEQPFTLPSGLKSPIYTDNKKLLAFPSIRDEIVTFFANEIKECFKEVDIIAGVASGAIAWGALVAQKLGLPFLYVRPEVKDFNKNPRIEGFIQKSQRVVIVEDLISSGKSSLVTADALSNVGGIILGMVALFSYNFALTRRNFENSNIELHTLCNYEQLLEQAVNRGILNSENLDILKEWSINPTIWDGIK